MTASWPRRARGEDPAHAMKIQLRSVLVATMCAHFESARCSIRTASSLARPTSRPKPSMPRPALASASMSTIAPRMLKVATVHRTRASTRYVQPVSSACAKFTWNRRSTPQPYLPAGPTTSGSTTGIAMKAPWPLTIVRWAQIPLTAKSAVPASPVMQVDTAISMLVTPASARNATTTTFMA